MILIKKQNIVDKESNGGKCKINYNDENNNDISLYKTKELENQIEKYKKEINSLKKLSFFQIFNISYLYMKSNLSK